MTRLRDNRKLDLMIQENSFSLNLLTWSYPQEREKNLGKNPAIFSSLSNAYEMGKGDIVSVYLNIDLTRYSVVCFILKYFSLRIYKSSLFKIVFQCLVVSREEILLLI